jgi:hypothetical protein
MCTTTYTTTTFECRGRELTITAMARRLTADELAEQDLDPGKPWAIILDGSETRYGPGSAVLGINHAEWDPDGEWRNDMRAEEPTEDDCRELAERIRDSYLEGVQS